MEYVLTVILTGLIAAGFPGNHSVLALAVDDGVHHRAYLLVLEGQCTSETAGACHHLAGDDPMVLRDKPMAWNLESGGWAYVDISLAGITSPVTKVDTIVDHPPGPFPRTLNERIDFHWVPSLTALSGNQAAELDDACFDLNQSPRDCGTGLAARLKIPFGRAGACHLSHIPEGVPSSKEACDFTARDESNKWVLIHDFVESGSGVSRTAVKAVADAISITHETKETLEVSMDDPKVKIKLSPDPDTNRLTLVFMNQAVEDILASENIYKRMTKRHDHFDHFYSLLEADPQRKLAPRLPHFQEERRAFTWPGPCEAYLKCLDYLFVGEHLYRMTTEEISSGLPVRRAVPHNYSQCDTATYP